MNTHKKTKKTTKRDLSSREAVNPYIALDDVGFLGLVQLHAVVREEVVGADAPVAAHAGDSLGFLGQGDRYHVQRCMVLGLDFFVVLLVFPLLRFHSNFVKVVLSF